MVAALPLIASGYHVVPELFKAGSAEANLLKLGFVALLPACQH